MATQQSPRRTAPPSRPPRAYAERYAPTPRPAGHNPEDLSGRLAVARQVQRVLGLPLGAARAVQSLATGGEQGRGDRSRSRAKLRLVEEE